MFVLRINQWIISHNTFGYSNNFSHMVNKVSLIACNIFLEHFHLILMIDYCQ